MGNCLPGWYCVLGSWSDKPSPTSAIGGKCTAGNFCPGGSNAETPCTPGYYCGTDELEAPTGPCIGGHYCSGSAIIPNPTSDGTGDVCPKGKFCPEGSATPEDCPIGTFNGLFQQNSSAAACEACTAGSYCPSTGLEAPVGLCDAGWFCPAGSSSAQPSGGECNIGHMCPEGSGQMTPCPSGFYQPNPQQGQFVQH